MDSLAAEVSKYDVQLLAESLENLAADVSEFEDIGALAVLDDEHAELLRLSLPKEKQDGVIRSPLFGLPQYMLRRAKMYRAWAHARERWSVPRHDLLNRVVHLMPLIYCEAATRKPHTQAVARLLNAAFIRSDESELRLHLREFKRDFPEAYRNIFNR